MSLEACLPTDLRGPATKISRIAAGLSGAGVYRVDAGGQSFALKIAGDGEPIDGWRRALQIQRRAAEAGLAPRVVHADEARRAVVSVLVDRPFLALYGDPRTREAALVQLGRTVRRVHELPLPSDSGARDPRELLATLWKGLVAGHAVPAFVGDAVRRRLVEEAPTSERAPVLSHNDVNPTNLVHDGERILLVDWDTAGPNDPFYDLAAIAVFLRLDDATCRGLLAAYDGAALAQLPARFTYSRRLVAVLCGVAFLHLARQSGHAGATGQETLEATHSLAAVYQRMQAGSLNVATAEGKWSFGLALVKESFAL